MKRENFFSYFYLVLISLASTFYFYTNASPYVAINNLRIYCYFVLFLLFVSLRIIQNNRVTIKPVLVNICATSLIIIMVIIQNYTLPELSYSEAQHLVEQSYDIDTVNTYLTTVYSDKGSDLYIITGYINGQEHLFSVHPNSKRIEIIGKERISINAKMHYDLHLGVYSSILCEL